MGALRSDCGNVRETVSAAPGNEGASATPSKNRSTNNIATPGATAWSAAIADHTATEATSPRRAPTLPMNFPPSGALTRYAIANADVSHP